MDFLKIEARNRATNALIDTVTFTDMEVRRLRKLLPYDVGVVTTVEGFSRVYPKNSQTEIQFEALLETAESVAKINKLLVYSFAGHVFDCEILAGHQFYSQPTDSLVRDPSDSVMLYGELTAFQRDWRVTHAQGLEWRTPCEIVIRAGKRPSVPTAAELIAYPPPIGGAGN